MGLCRPCGPSSVFLRFVPDHRSRVSLQGWRTTATPELKHMLADAVKCGYAPVNGADSLRQDGHYRQIAAPLPRHRTGRLFLDRFGALLDRWEGVSPALPGVGAGPDLAHGVDLARAQDSGRLELRDPAGSVCTSECPVARARRW